jgi:hypothetical protein
MKQELQKEEIEAWAVCTSGVIMTKFDHSHNVFTPRIYKTAEGARNVARRIESGGEITVVKCKIIYEHT